MNERVLDWENLPNARDLGGLGGVRRGALVRSGNADRLTARGWEQLLAHGVRTVVDLRNTEEYDPAAIAAPPEIDRVRLPLDGNDDREFWNRWETTPEFGTPLYYRPHLERMPERSAAVITAIARAKPGGVLFHCSAGRDRAGQIAMLVLAVLGVSAADIGSDYSMSHAHRPTDESKALQAYLAERGTTGDREIARILEEVDVLDVLRRGGATDDDFAALRARASEARSCLGSPG